MTPFLVWKLGCVQVWVKNTEHSTLVHHPVVFLYIIIYTNNTQAQSHATVQPWENFISLSDYPWMFSPSDTNMVSSVIYSLVFWRLILLPFATGKYLHQFTTLVWPIYRSNKTRQWATMCSFSFQGRQFLLVSFGANMNFGHLTQVMTVRKEDEFSDDENWAQKVRVTFLAVRQRI